MFPVIFSLKFDAQFVTEPQLKVISKIRRWMTL